MPKVTIDGREIEVEEGTLLFEAARRLGIPIPHYCYHPGLEPAGSCRMCLVDIEGASKLKVSCCETASEGMVVRTDTDEVEGARRAMLEFLLINHPLDCPVCDQAGECGLQDYYMAHGLNPSAMQEAKIVKSKKAFPIGDHILLDQERCVLCSRCVRFTEQVSKTHDLGIYNRGNRAVVDVAPGGRLSGNYTGNLGDICPVGALLDRDFRFKCRVWYLGSTHSICPGCSRGCNIEIHDNASGRAHKAEGARVMRLKPRFNPAVNGYWMCDVGRYGYKSIDSPDRIRSPGVAGDGADPIDMGGALDRTADRIRSLIARTGPESLKVIASPQQTNEDLFLADRLFRSGLGTGPLAWRIRDAEPQEGDGFLLQADRNPNGRGASIILGDREATPEGILDGCKGVVIFSHDLAARKEWRSRLGKVDLIVYVGPLANETSKMATVVLPSAVYAEREGTFTNAEGLVQRIRRAVEPLGESLPDSEILRGLAERLGVDLPGGGPASIFEAIGESVQAFQGMTYESVGEKGARLEGG